MEWAGLYSPPRKTAAAVEPPVFTTNFMWYCAEEDD